MMFLAFLVLMTLAAFAFIAFPLFVGTAGSRKVMIGALLVSFGVIAFLIYLLVGYPIAALEPLSQPDKDSQMHGLDLAQLADQLSKKLETQPDNVEGWALLARTYLSMHRYSDSVSAFEKATRLVSGDADLMADYVDAQVMNQGGKFDASSEAALGKLLELNPTHIKGLLLKGTMEFDRNDFSAAIATWEKIQQIPGLDNQTAEFIKQNIEQAKGMMQQPGKRAG